MTEYRRTRPRDGHERVFRALLRLFPAGFRGEFGDAMLEFFRDRVADARSTHGAKGVADAWLSALNDLARQAPLAWLDALRHGARRLRARFDTRPETDPLYRSRRKDWMLASILEDMRYGLRGMARAPGFSLVVIATLALGLGANVAIFSVVRGVLLAPLAYDRPDELVAIRHLDPYSSTSEPEFADYRRDAKSLAGLGASVRNTANLTGVGGEAERVETAQVSDGFFGVMRSPVYLGRTFTADEERHGGPPVAVIGEALWRRRYGADSSIVGRTIVLNGTARQVVGILPAGFDVPDERVAIWTPLRLRYDSLWARNNHYLDLYGRLAPGATVARAQEELSTIARRASVEYPQFYAAGQPLTPSVTPLAESVVGTTRPYLLALFGAVAFVLLIACVNVAGLLLARGEVRRRELAVRTAMGASRIRLTRQVLTESALHAVAGGALGVAIAWWGVRLLHLAAPSMLPRVGEIRVDGTVLLFATAIALLTGLAFGAWPALRASRGDTVTTLRDGGKGASGTMRSAGRARRRLVVAEVAIAVITLNGAGVMLRSLWSLQSTDLGFRPEGAMTLQVSLPPTQYRGERTVAFYEQLIDRVRALPGVQSVGAVHDLPLGDGYSTLSILLDGSPPLPVSQAPTATPQIVTSGYFAAMGIPLVRGRLFGDEDGAKAPLVAVVNEAMVREHWSTRDPIGATVRMGGIEDAWATVVGVVKDVRIAGFDREAPPTLYLPHVQAERSWYLAPARMSLVVRTSGGDPMVVAGPTRAAVRAMEPDAPVARVQTMEDVAASRVEVRRFTTRLLAGFALLALLLAGIGLYAMIAHGVAQRRQELGVRLALGARREQLLSLVVGEGVRMALAGALLGTVGAIGAVRMLRGVVSDLPSWDVVTLAAVVALLLGVALVASLVPARRASRVDPMPALRE